MAHLNSEHPDKPPEDSCLLHTMATALLLVAWLMVML